MGSSMLPLHQTACTVIVGNLLDRCDAHSEENRRMGRHLVKQFESNVFASVSSDVLKTFVKKYPSSVTSELVLLLAPPHLRVMDLTRCHNIGKHESDLQILKQALSKCTYLQSLILNEIRRCNGHDMEALMEAIVATVPQLTSISLEDMNIEDGHVQILLRGLPCLTSINLSMCAGLTDNVFYLSQNQLSELKTARDSTVPSSRLASVDLSGCQKLTNTCIRHLLELCGSNLRNLNVSGTQMDCTVLWYLSGYSLSSTVQLALHSSREQGDPNDGLAAKQLLKTMNTLQERLEEIQSGVLGGYRDGIQSSSSDIGTPLQVNTGEDNANGESLVTSETDSKEQIDAVGTSRTVARSSLEECPDAASGSSCSSSMVVCRTNPAETRDDLKDLDSVASSQLEALDVNSEVNTILLRDTKGGQSRLVSDLRIDSDSEISICSLPKTDQELKDTRQDKDTCDIEDVSLEIDSNGPETQGRVDTSVNAKYGIASSTQDQMKRGACALLKSNRSDELRVLDEYKYRICVTTDANMNVRNPSCINAQCQMCDHANSRDRLGEVATGSASGILEQEHDFSETSTCPSVGIARELSVNEQLKSRQGDTTSPNQRTALNLSFSEHVNKDSSSDLGDDCNPICQDALSFCVNVKHRKNSLGASAHLSDTLTESNEHISCADSGRTILPDTVPCPSENCNSQSSGFSAAATASSSVTETTHLGGGGSLPLNDPNVSRSSQTATVDASVCRCLANTKSTMENDDTHTDLSSEPRENLEHDPTLSATAMQILPANASSTSQTAKDDTNICRCLSNTPSTIEAEENDDTHTNLSSEPREDDPTCTLSAAAMQILPRLFEPNMVSLDICFKTFDQTLVLPCLEEYFSVNRNMQKLFLSQKDLTNDMLAVISKNIKELRHFSMYDCPEISNEALASFLKGCPRLQHLDIQGLSHVGDRGIYPLFELGDESRLSVIKLAETCITDITLNRIATTIGPKLQELVLLWCEDVTDAGLHEIALHCPSLKTFLLRQGTMRSETLQAFADNCPNLQDVSLSSVSCIAGDLMESVALRLKRLVTLDVSWNSDLTNQAVSAILSSCPALSQLLLCGVKQITDKPFLSIIANYSKWKRCQILIQLKVREQKLRRETGMAQLSSDEEFEDLYVPHRSTSYAPSLQDLNLSFCDHANDKRLQEIVAVCRGTLTVIDYYGVDIAPKLLHSL